MKKKQLNAMQRIISRSYRAEFNKIRPVTLCANRSRWIATDGFCAVVTPEKPEGVGIIGDESEKLQNMAAQKIVDNFLDDSQFGAENISLPSAKQLTAYIKLIGGGRKPQNLRPYPLNGGELWVNPVYLRDVIEAMDGSVKAYHNRKLSSPLMLWSDDHNIGVVMPMRFSKDENEKKELLELAAKAKEAAEAPPREKTDNQGQPTSFRAMKRAILSGVVIEMTKPNGKTITGNSLFNGRPTIDISAACSKYWEFEDGYCIRYWDAEEFSRLKNNWDYKIRVLGPMNPLTEEQRAAEAEEYKRRQDAHNAALAEQREKDAAEEKARREAEERYRAEQLAKGAEKIKNAIQAFKIGGHVDSCMVTTTENGHELEENIFVHLSRRYGVALPARSKGFIVSKLRCVEPNPNGESMRYSAQIKRKLPDGVKSFLFALMETIGEEYAEDTAIDEEIERFLSGDAAPEQHGENAPGAEPVYRYGMRLRGCSPGCQPSGFVDRAEDPTGKYHDILIYSQPLTEDQLTKYDLDDLNQAAPQTAKNGPTTREQDQASNDIAQPETGAYEPETSALRMAAHEEPENSNLPHRQPPHKCALPSTYVAITHAKLKELNYYARRAYVTPDAELKQFQYLKTGAGEEVNKATRRAANMLWLCEVNTS